MNATILGLRRGWTEQLNLWSDRKELLNALIGTVGTYVVLILFIGGNNVPGTPVSMAAFMTPGFLAFAVFSTGLTGLPMLIAADREEGTLMRARTLPGGIRVYLTGRAVTALLTIALNAALVLLVAVPLGGVAAPPALGRWLTLAWVLALGTLAVVPLGAAIGSLVSGPKAAAAMLGLPAMLLMLVSGVMFPVEMMPGLVRGIAQVFPLYWQGVGLRAVFLPDSVLAAELGHSWPLGRAAAVLGAWAVGGMVLAPWLLRRVRGR
ncbi:ABC-2 type transport system permease protein [Microbispora rosea]|uniref:Transport permease protein n=1 Tax=Microbispora rosea TaxID=58117 RepID=A0A1N6YD35_9ACTN|nr:ABC transporter permease [Microbispora rosea]GIH47137.1 transport permease protein [Microbispora rosea subsp. rosea]SIR12542.1 ABC-2 type transport system permease protein [Microbispora rosea]